MWASEHPVFNYTNETVKVKFWTENLRLKAALFLALCSWFTSGPDHAIFVAARNRTIMMRAAPLIFEELTGDELAAERYFRLVDETGRTIAITAGVSGLATVT